MLTLYHGSNTCFEEPSLDFAHDRRDFGVGFYTTTIKEQAKDWAHNVFQRYGGDGIFLYTFELDIAQVLRVKTFDKMSPEWLDLVKDNRLLGGIQHNYDIVIGPVADDNTVRTVSLYVEGIYDIEDAIKRLSYFKANDQVSLHTKAAMERLQLTNRDCLE